MRPLPPNDDEKRKAAAEAEAELAQREHEDRETQVRQKKASKLEILKAVKRQGFWWPGE